VGPQLLGTTLESTAHVPISNWPAVPGQAVPAGYGLLGLPAAVAEHGHGWRLVSGTMTNRSSIGWQQVRHSLLVTHVAPDKTGTRIHADYRLVGEDGAVAETGTAVFASDDEHPADAATVLRFATPEWGQAILPQLEASEAFRSAVQAYDGTIGIAGNGAEVHFRIYKGKVIEIGRRALKGSDFTVSASGTTWCQLILGERNDFMDRALKGEFSTTGSGYEYLRMTKGLVLIIDAARAAARTGGEAAK